MREFARETQGNIFEEVVGENYSGKHSWKGAQAIADKQLQQKADNAYDVYVPHPSVPGTTTMLKSHKNLGAAKDTVRDYLKVHPDHQGKTAIFSSRGKHVLDTKTNRWALLKEGSEHESSSEKVYYHEPLKGSKSRRKHIGTLYYHGKNEHGHHVYEGELNKTGMSWETSDPDKNTAREDMKELLHTEHQASLSESKILMESKFTGRLGNSRYTQQLDHLGEKLDHLYNQSGAGAVKNHLLNLNPKFKRHLHALSLFNMGQSVKEGIHPVAKIIDRHLKKS